MERYDAYSKSGYHFSLDKFEDHKLVSHLTARRATYDTTMYHRWIIRDYMIREMKGMREYITRGDRLDSIINITSGFSYHTRTAGNNDQPSA